MPHEQERELFMGLDEACSMIVDSEAWHAKAANQCRGLGIRGWGKWHDMESILHKKCLDKLAKLLQDKLDFTPELNLKRLEKIDMFQIENLDDFIKHHRQWIEREERFNDALTVPLKTSKKVNRALHEQLEKLEEEAQHQIALVKRTYKNIEFAEFMTHHILVVSKWMEDYFDYDYIPGSKIKFNIG